MERAGQADGSIATYGEKNAPNVSSSTTQSRTALILYGSETGNAQDVAEEVGRVTERIRFDTTVIDLDSVQLRDLLKPTIVIFAVSTTGQGELPQNARLFWKTLLSGALKPGSLRKVRYSSFGLGDSSYAKFNVAHRMLCGRLAQLGAQPFCERGEGNEQHPEGHSAGLREWTVALRQNLLESFPLGEGIEPLAEDVFLEPKWKLGLKQQASSEQGTTFNGNGTGPNGHLDSAKSSCTPNVNDPSLPPVHPVPIKGSHTAYITANNRVTAPDHFQDVRLLDLHLPENIPYGPGAVAVVYPKNFPEDVHAFITLMGWQDIADTPLTLQNTTDGTRLSPSPLRQLNLTHTILTLRWLLTNVLDIMSIPRRTFFATLAYFTNPTDPDSDAAYQKERLLELADPTLIDELWDYTTRPKRTILEALADFTTLRIPWQYALTALPHMKGRQFSIASGGDLRTPADPLVTGTRVQLLIAIAAPPSPIIRYRPRHGVCTRYVATLCSGQALALGMQPGYLNVQPTETAAPALMIGPGTGVAPLRALVWQRLLWAREQNIRAPGRKLEGDVLVFGCRSASGDDFFRGEWDELARAEGLSVWTAYSRDGKRGMPKRYVQDLIRERAGQVFEAVVKREGRVFVCGSSGAMPKSVREALAGAVAEGNEGMGEMETGKYMERMEREGRWRQETW